jgi:hypothetical protein
MPTYQPEPAALDPIETASTDELRALQQDRLRATLHHAYANVAHYRTAFDAAGVHPDDITSLDQLALLPFTTKDDLRRTYPFGMLAVARSQLARGRRGALRHRRRGHRSKNNNSVVGQHHVRAHRHVPPKRLSRCVATGSRLPDTHRYDRRDHPRFAGGPCRTRVSLTRAIVLRGMR